MLDTATGPWEPLCVRGPMAHKVVGDHAIDKYVREKWARPILLAKIWKKGGDVKFRVKVR